MRGMAKGMVTTIRHLLRPAFTEAYPWGPLQLPPRSRMSFRLRRDEAGELVCKACLLCEKSCPDGAIRITSAKREDAPGRELRRFEMDLGLCMYCGLCVESCTSGGLELDGTFENCSPERADMTLVLYAAQDAGHPLSSCADEVVVEPSPAGPDGGSAP